MYAVPGMQLQSSFHRIGIVAFHKSIKHMCFYVRLTFIKTYKAADFYKHLAVQRYEFCLYMLFKVALQHISVVVLATVNYFRM